MNTVPCLYQLHLALICGDRPSYVHLTIVFHFNNLPRTRHFTHVESCMPIPAYRVLVKLRDSICVIQRLGALGMRLGRGKGVNWGRCLNLGSRTWTFFSTRALDLLGPYPALVKKTLDQR